MIPPLHTAPPRRLDTRAKLVLPFTNPGCATERVTGKVQQPKTDVLPLCHATNHVQYFTKL